MQALRSFITGALALSLVASCSDDSGSGIVTKGATIAMSCVEMSPCSPPKTTQGTVAASQLDICTYKDSTKDLQVQFVEPTAGRVLVNIQPFTGDSTYQTTTDAKIDVTIAVKGDVPSNATASGPPEQKCTIIAASNLAKLQIPSNGDANTLDLTLDVTCPKLEAGGVCNVECTPSPSSFRLAVKGCTVSK
jgi:hypothetical protein